jgi:hypothetical protein
MLHDNNMDYLNLLNNSKLPSKKSFSIKVSFLKKFKVLKIKNQRLYLTRKQSKRYFNKIKNNLKKSLKRFKKYKASLLDYINFKIKSKKFKRFYSKRNFTKSNLKLFKKVISNIREHFRKYYDKFLSLKNIKYLIKYNFKRIKKLLKKYFNMTYKNHFIQSTFYKTIKKKSKKSINMLAYLNNIHISIKNNKKKFISTKKTRIKRKFSSYWKVKKPRTRRSKYIRNFYQMKSYLNLLPARFFYRKIAINFKDTG